MTIIINVLHLIGLFSFLGGALFRWLVWSAVRENTGQSLTRCVVQRSNWLMIAGTILFVVSVLADFDKLLSRSVFLSVSQIVLAPIFVGSFLVAERRNSGVLRLSTALVGLIIICLLGASSHAAAEAGFLATVSNIIHWIAVITFGGCLLSLPLLPWPVLYAEIEQGQVAVGQLVSCYAKVALVALAVAVLSGEVLAFVHVHNVDAMNFTQYGLALELKGAIVAVLLITLSVSLLKVAFACKQQAQAGERQGLRVWLRRFRILVSVEAILLAGLIVSSAILEARDPPGVTPFIRQQSWQMTVAEIPMTVQLQAVTGSASRVRIEISGAASDYKFPDGTQAEFDLYTAGNHAGEFGVKAVSIGPGGFLGETVLVMPGVWHFDLRLTYAKQTLGADQYELTIPAELLAEDLKAYLNLSAIGFASVNTISFFVGLLLALSAGWLARQAICKRAPLWVMPVSMANVALGAYLMLSIIFVRTYPTAFWTNPEPYTAQVIERGAVIYSAACAKCHGVFGKGDGPWAIENRGSIPALDGPHLDVHTDGDIFWWITHGIPSLDKPAQDVELTENERWAVINYTRSLRHGIPAL